MKHMGIQVYCPILSRTKWVADRKRRPVVKITGHMLTNAGCHQKICTEHIINKTTNATGKFELLKIQAA
jgi:hypothetical protein